MKRRDIQTEQIEIIAAMLHDKWMQRIKPLIDILEKACEETDDRTWEDKKIGFPCGCRYKEYAATLKRLSVPFKDLLPEAQQADRKWAREVLDALSK